MLLAFFFFFLFIFIFFYTSIFQLLDRSPGNPTGEGALSTDHIPDIHKEKEVRQNGFSQGDKRQQLVDIHTNEASQHPKWEKVLYVSMNLYNSLQCINSYLCQTQIIS
jgi:hypothetical protein